MPPQASPHPGTVAVLARGLRVHQWAKNLLIAVPLVTAHRWDEPDLILSTLLAMAAFSLLASGTYLINDLLDLEVDRAHPTKRNRPLAAGHLSPGAGRVLAALLILGGGALALPLGTGFQAMLLGYLVTTLAYSLRLKRVPMLDVVVLAGLYSARILAGHAAVGIPHSEWLLAFATFLFLSLALVKRYAELRLMRDREQAGAAGRGYVVEDLPLLGQLGTAAGFLAVLVFALYINSGQVRVLYRYPEALWPVIPLLLYWVARVWREAHHGRMNADPVLYALTDRTSYAVGVLFVICVATATGLPPG